MTSGVDPATRLKAMLASAGIDARPRADCPPPGDIWEAASETSAPARRREVVLHMAECPVCAEAWQLARSLGVEEAEAEATPPAPIWSPPRWLGAAAAVALVAVGLWSALEMRPGGAPPALTRDDRSGRQIESLIENRTLDRDRVVLRWSDGPEGATYSVVATTEDLEVVAEARQLAEARLVLDPAAVAVVPARGRLLWQVVARGPDGVVVESPTFVNRIADGGR